MKIFTKYINYIQQPQVEGIFDMKKKLYKPL